MGKARRHRLSRRRSQYHPKPVEGCRETSDEHRASKAYRNRFMPWILRYYWLYVESQ